MTKPIDRDSATWKRVEAWANERLTECRRKNDGDLDIVQTAKLRGRIAQIRDLLALDKPAPEARTDD